MKIAVTYDNGNVFQHFGKTENFKVYEVEDNKVVSSEVIGSNGTGHGALAGLLAEQGEGRRLVQQGGISVNDEKVTDFATAFEKAVFAGDGAIIRKGKKVFHKALVK